jgi:hypothetical protein
MAILGLSLLALATVVTAQAQEQTARLRVIHASPNAQDVDVLIDGDVAFSSISFNEFTDYSALPAGSGNVTIVPTGADEPILAELPVELQAEQDYTLVVAGKPPLIEPLLLNDNNTLPSASQARLRFIHVSPNVPEVDLVQSGGSTLFSNIPFKNTGTYISVSSGTYNLEAQIAGTGVAALVAPEMVLEGGNVYTIFLTGSAGGIPALQAVVSVDSGETVAAATTPTAAATTPTVAATVTGTPAPAAATPPVSTPVVTPTTTISPTVTMTTTLAVTSPITPTSDEDGIEPSTMPTTGTAGKPLGQFVLVGLGLVVVIGIVVTGIFSSRRRGNI